MIRRIHMVESLGNGGIFNHAVEVTAGLAALGADVVLHTATDCDAAPPSIEICRCVKWHRASANRLVRQVRTSARFLGQTLPHLHRSFGPDDIVHLQGPFAFTPELISVARRRAATVVCSPHNTFARSGAAGARRALDNMLDRADRVLVYSEADVRLLEDLRDRVAQVPLVQWIPAVRPELVDHWRTTLNPGGDRLALMPGQVRADKNPHLFVDALAGMSGWTGALVGGDLGIGAQLEEQIRRTGAKVKTSFGYVDVDNFVAVVAAADVVVAPYEVASQSGVLAVAARLGVPTAAAPCGGLGELATAVARDHSVPAIREAIIRAVETGATPVIAADAAKRFFQEYTYAHDRRSGNK